LKVSSSSRFSAIQHTHLDALITGMKLYSSQLSPFARKVRILVIEKGLVDQVEIINSNPYEATAEHLLANPLSKVPTLMLDDGNTLFDSHVICEYLDMLSTGTLIPDGSQRIQALKQLALTDGILETTFHIAVELNRREPQERSAAWVDRWFATLDRGVDALAASLPGYGEELRLPHIGLVCALDYLDLRASERLNWRTRQPALATWYSSFGERAAMQQTRPVV
jgi:glutathione S-transferase